MRTLLFIVALTSVCVSCKKENKPAGSKVEIYLLKSYQLEQGKCLVDEPTAVLQNNPLVSNPEIIAYAQNRYSFELTAPAIQKINALADRTAFALTVDREVVYYGIYKPTTSSSSCEHSITMNATYQPASEISLYLGYPGQLPGITVPDKRNDGTLLATLRKQGKLR